MPILTDIRRFNQTGHLPFGSSLSDQDAVFWEAVDVVELARRELARVKGGSGG